MVLGGCFLYLPVINLSIFWLLMGIGPKWKKKKKNPTTTKNINQQKITFCSPAKTTSSAPCKSHMTKSHDTHAHDWWKGKWKGEGSHGKYKTLKKIIQTWNVLRPKSTNRNTNNKKKTNYKHKYFSITLDTVSVDP